MDVNETKGLLSVNQQGVIDKTIKNYYLILANDDHFANLRYDTMKLAPCTVGCDGTRNYWKDSDEALARGYIEEFYAIRNPGILQDALCQLYDERSFSPALDRVRSFVWDGRNRVDDFFIKWAKAKNNGYSREASRLFFAQVISRINKPGSSADHVLVLKGRQGAGKSTLCEWLALEPQLYEKLTTLKGKDAKDNIAGKMICELDELLATTNPGTSDEEVKQFISTKIDTYRRSYGHHSADYPRTCVFIGTTNKDKFLTDPTGNRRWYPLDFRQDGRYLYAHENEVKSDIAQCYAEMQAAYESGLDFSKAVPRLKLLSAIKKQQEDSEMEDPRIGQIAEYLRVQINKGITKTYCLDVWKNALGFNPTQRPMKRSDANEIGELLRHKIGCSKLGTGRTIDGPQAMYKIPEGLKTVNK